VAVRQRLSGTGQVHPAAAARGGSSGARRPGRIRGKRWWLVVVTVVESRRLVVVGRWCLDPLFSCSGSPLVASLRWNGVLPVVVRQIW
jgi:hypothetical protein